MLLGRVLAFRGRTPGGQPSFEKQPWNMIYLLCTWIPVDIVVVIDNLLAVSPASMQIVSRKMIS